MIEIRELSRSYGEKMVLRGITADFPFGRSYGIVGANGSGKTTFFDCLAGIRKFSGNITPDVQKMKDRLGLLPTEPYFFPKITGREYLLLLCQARGKDAGDLDKRNIFSLPLDEYATNYSTGMKKKLAFTAILLQENEIFILDEPFNGVDITSNIIIMEILRELRGMGKTLVISSHVFSTLKDACDEIHLLENGVFKQRVDKADFDVLERSLQHAHTQDIVQRLGLK